MSDDDLDLLHAGHYHWMTTDVASGLSRATVRPAASRRRAGSVGWLGYASESAGRPAGAYLTSARKDSISVSTELTHPGQVRGAYSIESKGQSRSTHARTASWRTGSSAAQSARTQDWTDACRLPGSWPLAG